MNATITDPDSSIYDPRNKCTNDDNGYQQSVHLKTLVTVAATLARNATYIQHSFRNRNTPLRSGYTYTRACYIHPNIIRNKNHFDLL